MRELVFSVGITFLTGTLIFVYFRNKMNNIDKKVNMVFETIQEHNVKMQRQAQMEMQRFAAYQESRMASQESREVEHVEQNEQNNQNAENAENNEQKQGAWNSEANSDTNLIDVSEDDSDSDGFDSSEEDDDNMNDDDDNMNDDTDKITEVGDEISDKLKISDGLDGLEGLEVLDGKLAAEINLEKKIIQPNVDYTKLTKAQLINCCEDAGISFKKSSNKSVLIQLLENSNQPVVNLEQ